MTFFAYGENSSCDWMSQSFTISISNPCPPFYYFWYESQYSFHMTHILLSCVCCSSIRWLDWGLYTSWQQVLIYIFEKRYIFFRRLIDMLLSPQNVTDMLARRIRRRRDIVLSSFYPFNSVYLVTHAKFNKIGPFRNRLTTSYSFRISFRNKF